MATTSRDSWINSTTGLISAPAAVNPAQPAATQTAATPSPILPSPAAPQPPEAGLSTPSSTQPAQASANLQTVAEDQTVSGALDKMLAADSPYIQRAQARSMEQSNARGLLNSSMAAGAGTAAAIDAALPIAQGNASLFADSRNRNQDAMNSTGQFNANQTNQFGLADKNIQAQTARDATLQKYTQSNMGLAQGFDLTKMDKQAAITLGQMSVQQQNDVAKMAVAQGYNLQTMSAQQINDLAKMSTASDLDLKKLATAQGYNLETMNAAQVLDLEKMAAASGYTIEQMEAATAQDLIRMAEEQGYDLAKMAEQQGYNIATMDKQQLLDLAKMDKTYTQADKEAQTKFGYDKQLMEIQKSSNIEVAGIEAQYRNLTQASTSAANLSTNVSNNINQILLNKDITGDSTVPDPDNEGKFLSNKQVAINQVMGNYKNSLQLIGVMAGDVDLMSFMDEALGTGTTTPVAGASSPTAPTAPTTPTTPAPPAPLNDADRSSVIAEAARIGTEQGISQEQALYNYAIVNNISPEQLDAWMAFPPGTTQAWAQSQPGLIGSVG